MNLEKSFNDKVVGNQIIFKIVYISNTVIIFKIRRMKEFLFWEKIGEFIIFLNEFLLFLIKEEITLTLKKDISDIILKMNNFDVKLKKKDI